MSLLTTDEEEELKRKIAMKTIERGGHLTEDDRHEIAFDFIKDHKNVLKGKNLENVASTVLSSHAKEIHTANVIKINNLIDKVEKGLYTDGFAQLIPSLKMEPPKDDCWSFELGCKVVVDLPKARFKFLQKKTLGWAKRLANVHGQYGYVTNVKNKFDCKIQVYFPEILTSTMVYAGVLSKTDTEFHGVASRWRVGQFVRTKRNKIMVKKFQQRLPDLPEKNLGKQGKVIAITSAGVFVTFNGVSSYAINPALLQGVTDPEEIKAKTVTDHPKGFRVGMKVRVTGNLKNLIENQKDFGGWNWRMSSILGKVVRIVHIKSDGSLIVGLKTGRTWRLNYESVFHESSPSAFYDEYETNEILFRPGDIVRLRLTSSIKIQLVAANVLESCMDFLKLPGKVEGIDDDFDVVVRFCNGKKRILSPSLIQKVSRAQSRQFQSDNARKMSLEKGDMVRICPGPVRYVKEILAKMKLNSSTQNSLIEEAQLMGYTDDEHAVIQYEKKYAIRINTKYLVPAKQMEFDHPEKVGFDSLKSLVESIESCIAVLNIQGTNTDMDGSVDIFCVTTGCPPTVCLRINSPLAKPENVISKLRELTPWDITGGCESEFSIKMDDELELDVVLLSHEEEKSGEELKSLPESTSEITQDVSNDIPTPKQRDSAIPQQPLSANHGPHPMETLGTPQGRSAAQGFDDFRYFVIQTAGGYVQVPYVPQFTPTSAQRDTSTTRGTPQIGNYNTNIILQTGEYGRMSFNNNN